MIGAERSGALAASPRVRRARLAIMLFAALSGVGLEESRRGQVAVLVDAEVSDGTVIELFHNERWLESQRLPLEPGRHLYRFEPLPDRLWSLRLDPSDSASAHIVLHGVAIEKDGRRVADLGPPALRNWAPSNLEVLASGTEGLEFKALSPDPILLAPGTYDFSGSGALPRSLPGLDGPLAGAIAFLLLFAIAGLLPWRGWRSASPGLVLLSVPVSLVVARGLAALLDRRLGGSFSAARAVGLCNYSGYPKLADFRLYAVTVLGLGLLGLGCGLLLSRLRPPSDPNEEARPEPDPRLHRILAVALVALFALMTFPPLADRLAQLLGGAHRLAYDDANNFSWYAFVHRGLRPFRDFWYPYGFFSGLDAGGWFPTGYLLGWAHRVLVLAVAAWALRRTARVPDFVRTAVLAVLVAGTALGLFEAPGRYFLALDMVLLGLAARSSGYARLPLLVLAGFATYAFVLEPNQVLYAGLPLAPVLAIDLWGADPVQRRRWARAVVLASAAFGVGLTGVLLGLAWRRQLAGFANFLGQMGVMTTYGSLPADFRGWYRFDGSAINLVLDTPLVLVLLGCAFAGWRRRIDDLAAPALAFGLLGAFVFNKFLVRPHIAGQVAVYSIVGSTLFLAGLLRDLRVGQRALVTGLVAFLGAMIIRGDGAPGLVAVRRSVEDLPRNIRVLGGDHRAAELAFYEDPRRYPGYQPVIDRLRVLTTGPADPAAAKFYVLGDDSVLYVVLGQHPPYYISFYNASPLEAQEKNLAWLAHERPRWMVWRPGFESFDAVPNVLRVPLLFGAAIVDYEPRESAGELEILERRSGERPVNVEFWARHLGSRLDLQALPARSGLRKARSCTGGECVEALHVHIAAPVAGRQRRIPVTTDGHRFELTFTEEKGTRDYFVHLGHVWFYGALERAGLKPQLDEDLGEGARAERLFLAAEPRVLW